MASVPQPRCTPEEYLEIERKSEQKHQYFDGQMFAMSGASRRHNLIVTNLVRELSGQLKGRPCEVFPSDMRVKVSPTGLYTYPDVTVVCEDACFEDDREDTLLNPRVVIEVLSASTEDYDRGRKFQHYRQVESLEEYVLISQENRHVEGFRRRDNHQWLFWETDGPEDTVTLTSIDCQLPLAEIYDKVEIGALGQAAENRVDEFFRFSLLLFPPEGRKWKRRASLPPLWDDVSNMSQTPAFYFWFYFDPPGRGAEGGAPS